MKKIISIISVTVLLILCSALSGCSSEPYTSSYNAVGLVQTYDDSSAIMSFSEFQGVKVYKLRFEDSFSKSLIYKLRLETGSATIYYDTDGTKKELVSLRAGDRVDEKLSDLTCSSMYIIVETSEKCMNGKFSFETKVL